MLALDSEAMIFYKPHNKSIEVDLLLTLGWIHYA